MQLNAGHRRNVIEDLLDINIFSKMNIILRERNSTLKENINTTNNETNIVKSKIEQQTKYIRDIAAVTEENKGKYEKQIKSGKEKIKKLQDENNNISKQLEESTAADELKEIQKEKNEAIAHIAEIKQEMKAIAKRGMFLEKNDECPTCDQPIANKEKLVFDTKNEAYQVQSTLNMVEGHSTTVDRKIIKLE